MIPSTRAQRRQLKRTNATLPTELREIPRESWPLGGLLMPQVRVLRSSEFLVQEYIEPDGMRRLSINRTTLGPDGRWIDGITWDELQQVKAQAGYADSFAVEIYPAAADVVDVANIRHLWILPAPPSYAWRSAP